MPKLKQKFSHLIKSLFGLIFTFLIVSFGHGQSSTFYTGFENNDESLFTFVSPDSVKYTMQNFRPQYAAGISGRALDLSEDASLRRPVVLGDNYTMTKDSLDDLSAQIWIRTKTNAPVGTIILGNVGGEEVDGKGWAIYSRPNGSWGVRLNDGRKTIEYEPTDRQTINDGSWHHLAFALDRDKEEVWFYYDGKNVGIYQINSLGSLESTFGTTIGGSDSYWEYGTSGQWTAFNGYVDEVRIQAVKWNAEQISHEYAKYRNPDFVPVLNSPIRVMTWNIWHGGRRFGKHVGLNRVIETIRDARPDVVGLIETYGSGEIIADSLGYYYYLISSNLSIMSRFPIKETIQAFQPFNFGGAVLNAGNGKEIVMLDTWLYHLPRYSINVRESKFSVDELIEGERETRFAQLQAILKGIEAKKFKEETPVFFVGDFNSGSHLDWTENTKELHYGYVVEWPVSKRVIDAGFKDSFRTIHIDALQSPGVTWTPIAANSTNLYGLRDRIDYIYYRGPLKPIESRVIDYHPVMFPSDHAAVISVFEWQSKITQK